MVRTFCRIAVLAAVALATPALAGDDATSVGVGPVFGTQQPMVQALQIGGPTPAQMAGGLNRPKLYDNTQVCTVDTISLAVGGGFSADGPPLSVRDWFTTSGGRVVGFDLFVMNGGPGALPNHLNPIQFFTGTDSENLGTPITIPAVAGFTSAGLPLLSRIPVHQDPITGEPLMMRVTVDFLQRTYTVVDAETGTPLISPAVQDIGDTRPSFVLPPGKIGVNVRFDSEPSLCAGGTPRCGVVLARGGGGNENGLHMTNATLCTQQEAPLVCDNPGWQPTDVFGNPVPCVGGNTCTLNRPFFGVALALFVGPGESDLDGNNEQATADVILADIPAPGQCSGDMTTINGFIGDNPVSYTGSPITFFDCNGDDVLDVIDYGCYQRCVGRTVTSFPECQVFDQNLSGTVDIDDYFGFFFCSLGLVPPDNELCVGTVPDPPVLLQDVDLYEVPGLSPGQVLSVLLDGDKSPAEGPTWDPYLKIFQMVAGNLVVMEVSDDYERLSLDGFTTVVVPAGATRLWVGVSAAQNNGYDPMDPQSSPVLMADDAGGYSLTVAVVNPDCVVDNFSGQLNECYTTKHEPDDSIPDSDARGALCDPETPGCLLVRGMIGDGAFSAYGQDVDIWKISLTGARAGVRSLTAQVKGVNAGGFDTVFDLVLGLYNSSGELIATADQSSQVQLFGFDQTRPLLGSNAAGSNTPGADGIYYLAIFGTDRVTFDPDSGCTPMFPSIPPTLLNFPHGVAVAATNDADLRPMVGGRVNKPLTRIKGCTSDPIQNPPETRQCYRINVSTFTNVLPTVAGAVDICDSLGANGDDSIPDACTINTADRLSLMEAPILPFHLGNGRFGGQQGDVDFYRVPAAPGKLLALVVADDEQPPTDDNRVRSYLGWFDSLGFLFADHDYSLEHADATMFDGISDEIAATAVGTMPAGIGPTAFAMVGIDNGNMLRQENTPFDAAFPGTTLSRRFETGILSLRAYDIGVAVIDPIVSLPGTPRMFVAPSRGVDDIHTSCFVNGPNDGNASCYPPILEVDPLTGDTVTVLDGGQFFDVMRPGTGIEALNQGLIESANPLVAYDGQDLFVTVEVCRPEPQFCTQQNHPLFRIDPDAGTAGFASANFIGNILGFGGFSDTLSGMVEMNGTLVVFNSTADSFRFWGKTLVPIASVGGTLTPTPSAPADDPRWDDLDGDLGSDGTDLYVSCSYEGAEVGICVFRPDFVANTITFMGKLLDPISNLAFTPGPRLGGLDLLGSTVVASDRNGPIVEHWSGWNLNDPKVLGNVVGFELPREFLVQRLTIR